MPDLSIENQYPNQIIAGIDEAGRGPLAGPVVAAAVIINPNHIIHGIRDSKKITAKDREVLYGRITSNYIYSIGVVQAHEIDEINILQATIRACHMAESSLKLRPDIVIVDGNMKFNDNRFVSIIKGDDKSLSIAAASIVAKVTRDRIMQQLDQQYPMYGWNKNAGYGTKTHIESMMQYGLTEQHRKSFKLRNKPIIGITK